MQDELKKVKSEIKDILSIQPEDNLRFLQNQIELGNIKMEQSFRVLTILKRIEIGMQANENKINELRKEVKQLKK